jgi:hypothetical protein
MVRRDALHSRLLRSWIERRGLPSRFRFVRISL